MRQLQTLLFPLFLTVPLALCFTSASAAENADTSNRADRDPWQKNLAWQGFFEEHCLDCHDAADKKGGIDIESLLEKNLADHQGDWEFILRQIKARQMPPLTKKKRPTESEFQKTDLQLTNWLDQLGKQNFNPGRTNTLRRLNRTEYKNAIRDLLKLDVDIKNLIPADNASHGFDNITVTDLSPSLLQRYISAAQKIARAAISRPRTTPDGKTYRVAAEVTQDHHVEGLPLGTRGGLIINHHFAQAGEYQITVNLARDRDEKVEGLGGTTKMLILLDPINQPNKAPLKTFEIKSPKNRNDHTKVDQHLSARLTLPGGPQTIGVTFIAEAEQLPETLRKPFLSHFNVHRHPRQGPAVYQASITGPFNANSKAESPNTVSREQILAFKPSNQSEERTSAAKNLKRLMRLAYRRPVNDQDLKRIMPFYDEGFNELGGFDGGMERALSAILVSRDFLFRIETDPAGSKPGDTYKVSDELLASRLSFFLWSSIPDNELLALAEQKQLSKPEVLKAQIKRMLQDKKASSLATNFAEQWFVLRNLQSFSPDARLYPDFDDNLRDAMREETLKLFEDIIREDQSVLNLIDNNQTWLNERLAKHYGIPNVYGTKMRKVKLDPKHPMMNKRGGLLRHGSFLTVTSYANRTSPVLRGHWILENIMGTPPPNPPTDVPSLESQKKIDPNLPIRERLAAHRNQASCAGCHAVLDPPGFALENYDAIGQWRGYEKGNAIDATGELPDGSAFNNVATLEKAILKRPQLFVRTMTEKLITFGLGRGFTNEDAPIIRKIVQNSSKDNYKFHSLIREIVTSPLFTHRMTAYDSKTKVKAGH